MDQVLTSAIARISFTSNRFKLSQQVLQEAQDNLIEAQENLIKSQNLLMQAQTQNMQFQRELAVDLQKLLLGVQGYEALNCIKDEIGNRHDLLQLHNLCKEAQSVEYVERNYMETLAAEIDLLSKKIIEQQQEEFNIQETDFPYP